MAASILDFYLFVFIIFAFNGTTLSMTFGMARDIYGRCKYVAYGSY